MVESGSGCFDRIRNSLILSDPDPVSGRIPVVLVGFGSGSFSWSGSGCFGWSGSESKTRENTGPDSQEVDGSNRDFFYLNIDC